MSYLFVPSKTCSKELKIAAKNAKVVSFKLETDEDVIKSKIYSSFEKYEVDAVI